MSFNAPPNWPQPPAGWTPPPNWQPPAEWGPAPEGWNFWEDNTDAPASGYTSPEQSYEPAAEASRSASSQPNGWAMGSNQHRAYIAAPAPQYSYNQAPTWGMLEGRRHRTNSTILGVIGLLLLPILGPFAIWQANKAERLGISATAGKVLGIIATVWGILVFLFFLTGG